MDKNKLSEELLKLAKTIDSSGPEHDKAYNMIKSADDACVRLVALAIEVDKELKQAEMQIKNLEKFGSGRIEAPIFLEKVLGKVEYLNKFTKMMIKEIKLAIGSEE